MGQKTLIEKPLDKWYSNSRVLAALVGLFAIVILSLLFGSSLIIRLSTQALDPTQVALLKRLSGKITFTANVNGQPQIYIANADGTNQQRLTDGEHDGFSPLWSPDRKLIAFYSNRNPENNNPKVKLSSLYVMNSDGSNQHLISATTSINGLSWSPDSKQLAFVMWREEKFEVDRINVDGSGDQTLSNASFQEIEPLWSSDGKHIYFSSFRDQNSAELYIMDADSSNQHLLTKSQIGIGDPSLSPNGQYIVYSSINGIYITNQDGSHSEQLTNGAEDNVPIWSPDGNHVAFISGRNGMNEIYVMDADGNNETGLTSNSAFSNWNPVWSPDSQWLAFNSNRDGTPNIYVMDTSGKYQYRLVDTGNSLTISS